MDSKELKFWHGGTPPKNPNYSTTELAILFAISRNQPYTSIRDKYNVRLAEIYHSIVKLRKMGNLKFDKNGVLLVNRCKYQHISNKKYGEIYDIVAKHSNTDLIRLDDFFFHINDYDFTSKYYVQYAIRHPPNKDFGRSALRAITTPSNKSLIEDISSEEWANHIIKRFEGEVSHMLEYAQRQQQREREYNERQERLRNPGVYVI